MFWTNKPWFHHSFCFLIGLSSFLPASWLFLGGGEALLWLVYTLQANMFMYAFDSFDYVITIINMRRYPKQQKKVWKPATLNEKNLIAFDLHVCVCESKRCKEKLLCEGVCTDSNLTHGLNPLQEWSTLILLPRAVCWSGGLLQLSSWLTVRTAVWKGGFRVKGVDSPTRGVLEKEAVAWDRPPGLWEPSVWAATARQPLPKKKRERAGLKEGAGTLAPAAGSMGRTPAHPFKSHRPDVPCQGALGLS